MRLITFLTIAAGIVAVIVNPDWLDKVLKGIKIILDFEPLYPCIIAVALLLGIYYSFYYARKRQAKKLSLFKVFGPLLDPPVNSLGYSLVITSTLTFFRGIYNQKFFGEMYFSELGLIDIATILIACIPLLIWSVDGLLGFFFAIFVKDRPESGRTEGVQEKGTDTESEEDTT